MFNDNNSDLRDLFQIEDMIKVFNVLGIGAVFGTNQHIRRLQNEPRHEITGFLHMRKQRRRSASR